MEFLEFLLLFVAVMIIIMKPEKEKLAWWLTVDVSTAILGSLNL